MESVERYRAPTRVLHWVHAAAFLTLVITGAILYVPPLGPLAAGGLTRFIHRIAAVLFMGIPILYLLTNWRASLRGIKDAFTWGKDDLGWLMAAPAYYFLGSKEAMPPQDHMNTGQKLYWLLVIVTGVVFSITGLLMWLAKDILPASIFQWSVFLHDVCFILILAMFFVHLYLSVFHPLMAGVWKSMFVGSVPASYAKLHHAKWYERVIRGQE